MEIVSIKNKDTNQEVCLQYLHKKLNPYRTKIIVGEELVISYEGGTGFNHETVVNIKCFEDDIENKLTTQVETTKKVWVIQ